VVITPEVRPKWIPVLMPPAMLPREQR
jgi:hypothetical protein